MVEIDCSHGKGIALRVGFVILIGFIVIICTALPLAITSSNSTNEKVKSASSYAWASFAFEFISIALIAFASYEMYKCVETDPNRQGTWFMRCKDDVSRAAAAATSVQQGASKVATNMQQGVTSAGQRYDSWSQSSQNKMPATPSSIGSPYNVTSSNDQFTTPL